MKMINIATTELEGAALRYAVAKAMRLEVKRLEEGDYKADEPHWWMVYNPAKVTEKRNGLVGYIHPVKQGSTGSYSFSPDTDWNLTGPLVDFFKVAFVNDDRECTQWLAYAFFNGDNFNDSYKATGPNHLIAACRAIVYAVIGQHIDVPEELATGKVPCAQ